MFRGHSNFSVKDCLSVLADATHTHTNKERKIRNEEQLYRAQSHRHYFFRNGCNYHIKIVQSKQVMCGAGATTSTTYLSDFFIFPKKKKNRSTCMPNGAPCAAPSQPNVRSSLTTNAHWSLECQWPTHKQNYLSILPHLGGATTALKPHASSFSTWQVASIQRTNIFSK